jgi:hypothetical protein
MADRQEKVEETELSLVAGDRPRAGVTPSEARA